MRRRRIRGNLLREGKEPLIVMLDATKPAQFYERITVNLNSAGFDTALEKLASVDSADEAWQLFFSMRPRLPTTLMCDKER